MLTKIWKISIVLLALAALTFGCSSPQTPAPTATQAPAPTAAPSPTPAGIEIVDGLGTTIRLAGPAQRVVSLAPSNTEILFAVGAGAQVVGRDEFTNYPAEALNLPSVGGSMGNYNAEAIVGLKPDLVLAAEINSPELIKELQNLGLTVFYLSNPVSLDGMYANLSTVAQLTGQTEQTNTMIEALKQRVAAVKSQLGTPASLPTVFYELDASTPNAPYTIGPGSFMDLLIKEAGGVNITADQTSPWVQLSLEALVVKDPEIILLGDSNYGVTPESVGQRAGWEDLKAVKNGKVLPFNDDLVSRPGPRLVDGLEELAKLFHPEIFK
jgi:iron complex transport system substrate-binding protein